MGTKYANSTPVGTRFGKWTVTATPFTDQRGRAKVHVKCECGNESNVFLFSLTKKRSTQCKTCSSGKSATLGSLANRVFRVGLGEGVDYKLSPEFLSQSLSLQSSKCAISGEPLTVLNLSAARWDSTIGYTPENTVLVSNTMKQALSVMKTDVKHFVGMVATPSTQYNTVQEFLNKRENQQ